MSDPDAPAPDSATPPPGGTVSESTPAPKPAAASGGLDLSSLQIMPAWVTQVGGASSISSKSYDDERERPGKRGDHPRRFDRDRGRGAPRPGGDRPPRPSGDRPAFRRDDGPGQDRGPRRQGQGGGRGDGRRDHRDRDRDQGPRRDWIELPKDVHSSVHPDDKSLESLSAYIRSTGHAFSLFDVARLVLADGERFGVRFLCEDSRAQPLIRVPADGSLFLTRDEALRHVLSSSALETWYRVEEIELEEPKGNFPSVAICGLSGELLGPASHHSFQTAIIRLHRERYANMPLEDYKRRIRTEADPELVQKWKDQQRKAVRWIPLTPEDGGEEAPAPLSTRHDMETHFRRHHGEQAIAETRDVTVPGSIDKKQISPALFILLRQAVESARKHLFEMSQKLSAGFDRRGLKTFKRRAGKMFVCRVRPRAIDPSTVFAERLTAIVERLKNAPGGLQVTALVKSLAPDTEPAPPAAEESNETNKAAPADAAATALNDDQVATLKDLRWLANEGYIIEYSDGLVCLGVQGEHPAPKPQETTPAAPAADEQPAPERSADAPVRSASDEQPQPERSADATVRSPTDEQPQPEPKAVPQDTAPAEEPTPSSSDEGTTPPAPDPEPAPDPDPNPEPNPDPESPEPEPEANTDATTQTAPPPRSADAPVRSATETDAPTTNPAPTPDPDSTQENPPKNPDEDTKESLPDTPGLGQ